MDKNSVSGTLGETGRDIKEYASLRTERLRLNVIENVSILLNSLFGVFILIVLLGIGVTFFAVALTWVLSLLLGSLLWAITLMGGLFVLLALIVYALRKRLIVNQAVRMLSSMADDINKKHSGYE